MEFVLIRLSGGKEMIYRADAVKIGSNGGLFVAVNVFTCTPCEFVNFIEAE